MFVLFAACLFPVKVKMLIHGCLTLFIDSINKMKDGCRPYIYHQPFLCGETGVSAFPELKL